MCIFFYIMKEFPSIGKVNQNPNETIITQISEFIDQMGDNFEAQMTSYFEDFKKPMKKRVSISISLVEKNINDICFLVDIDFNYIQATVPRVRWIRPLGYELDVDEASTTITALLAEEIDKSVKPFGTYDVVKSKVEIELKTASIIKKKDKLVKKIKKKFGEGIEAAEEEEEEDDDDDDEDE